MKQETKNKLIDFFTDKYYSIGILLLFAGLNIIDAGMTYIAVGTNGAYELNFVMSFLFSLFGVSIICFLKGLLVPIPFIFYRSMLREKNKLWELTRVNIALTILSIILFLVIYKNITGWW